VRNLSAETAGFPLAIGILLALCGIALIGRAMYLPAAPTLRWGAAALGLIAALFIAEAVAIQLWGFEWSMRFGPAEFAAVIVLRLAVAIALARASRLRGFGMVLLGLLLSVIGLDISTGILRLTFGSELLVEGIILPTAALGILVVADAALCLYSPSRFLVTYARQLAGWTPGWLARAPALALRLVALVAIAAAAWAVIAWEGTAVELVPLALFGAFGFACRICDWNRLLLLIALGTGTQLEENIRRALLVSRNDPEIFVRSPIAAVLLAAAVVALALAAADRCGAFRARGDSR